MLVKNGAIIAISNKYGDTPLSKARPRLRKKLEALAGEYGQSLVIVPHKSKPLCQPCMLRNRGYRHHGLFRGGGKEGMCFRHPPSLGI